MIRVLVVEDSPTSRALMVAILRSDPEIQVVGEAGDGIEAIEIVRRVRPDLVIMDLHMPRMGGLEATKAIMTDAPTPIVIVSASDNLLDVAVSMHALRAGALAVLPKPPGPDAPDFDEVCRRFVATAKAMSQVKVVRHWPVWAPPRAAPPTAHAAPRIVAIAASTGGPAALDRLLARLPGGFPVPIVIVQHLSAGFVDGLAAWLNGTSSLRVQVARDGQPLEGGTVSIAPDGRHMGIAGSRAIGLSDAPSIQGFRPSATHLFASVGAAFGAAAVGVILTGMGEDGVEGLRALRAAGGRVIAEDESSAVVFGMPGAAIEAGVVNEVLPLSRVAARLLEICHGQA